MTHRFIELIEQFILPLGAPGVFAASVLEEIIAIIPSPIVQMGSGFLFLGGQEVSTSSVLSLIIQVSIPASLGVTLGSLVIYAAAYYIGKPAIDRFGKYFFLRWSDIEQTQKIFDKGWGDEAVIFIARALPIIPSVAIAGFCGLLRIDIKKYIVFTFLGTLVRATFLGFIGWQAGSLYTQYSVYVDALERIGLIIIAIGAGMFILYGRYRKTYGQ